MVNSRRWRFFSTCLIVLYLLSPATLVADDYAKARSLLLDAKNRVDRLSDYTVILTSQERVGGVLLPEATMFVKFKRPFSVYIKNLSGKQKDREIIYVKGKNNDKMIVSRVSILGRLATKPISPNNFLAKRESRHTITEAGLPNTMGRMVTILEKEDKAAARRPTVTYLGECYRSSKKVISVRIENSSYAPKTEIALDAATFFPVSITSYDADGSLLESYNYRDIKPNVGLTDADFDPTSPAYHF
jgi:hypothetical protein